MDRINIPRTCINCLQTFTQKPWQLRMGRGKYCTRECSFAHGKPIETKFWAKVEKTETCWLWTGTLNNKGYGETRLNKRYCLAHRASYELAYGPIPEGLKILHKCDVPRCVNPDHLELGTQASNMRDCFLKGRTARGTRNGHAILTDERVREARTLYATGSFTYEQLGHRFGVDRQVISSAIRRLTWRHVE